MRMDFTNKGCLNPEDLDVNLTTVNYGHFSPTSGDVMKMMWTCFTAYPYHLTWVLCIGLLGIVFYLRVFLWILFHITLPVDRLGLVTFRRSPRTSRIPDHGISSVLPLPVQRWCRKCLGRTHGPTMVQVAKWLVRYWECSISDFSMLIHLQLWCFKNDSQIFTPLTGNIISLNQFNHVFHGFYHQISPLSL